MIDCPLCSTPCTSLVVVLDDSNPLVYLEPLPRGLVHELVRDCRHAGLQQSGPQCRVPSVRWGHFCKPRRLHPFKCDSSKPRGTTPSICTRRPASLPLFGGHVWHDPCSFVLLSPGTCGAEGVLVWPLLSFSALWKVLSGVNISVGQLRSLGLVHSVFLMAKPRTLKVSRWHRWATTVG